MKKYIKGYEEYDDRIDKEIVNPEDADYGYPLTVVEIGNGGYSSSTFYVYCDPRDAETALKKQLHIVRKKDIPDFCMKKMKSIRNMKKITSILTQQWKVHRNHTISSVGQ